VATQTMRAAQPGQRVSYRKGSAGILLAALIFLTLTSPAFALHAQQRGVVVDQTGLPLPGARINVLRGDDVLTTVFSGLDGSFDIPDLQPADKVEVSLDGFETARVEPAAAGRIVLPIARATETTEVVASTLTSAGASMEHLGSTMTAPLAQRLPTPRPRILQSLPLLPAVVRGRDGLLRIGGTRPHESALWIDGLNVTDPVSGTTTLDLPVESVRGMAVLREPVSAEFSDTLGSAASIETTPGHDSFRSGIQGFIPRPRLSRLGLGQIEAFFPRVYVGGRIGIARVFASAEFNFERVPVAGVTGESGKPYIGTTGVTSFVRFDLQPSTRHNLTVSGLFAPATTTAAGLSSLRPEGTVPDVSVNDMVGTVVDRYVIGSRDVLTIRVGAMMHHSDLATTGAGDALLTPEGWRQNWYSSVDVDGWRQSLAATWERADVAVLGSHSFLVNAAVRHRSMDGSIGNQPIFITDNVGRTIRVVDFGQPGALNPSETMQGVGMRDLWDVNQRLQIDLGLRVDGGGTDFGPEVAPRVGVRYLLDEEGRTILRGSIGRYVGRVPLGADAFAQFPSRTVTTYDPVSGLPTDVAHYTMALNALPLPYTTAAAVEIEHHLSSTFEVQLAARQRTGTALPTVMVPQAAGVVTLGGVGTSRYREFQISGRKTWPHESQLFVSYVRAIAEGDVNDFGTLYTNLDTPILQPGGQAPTQADVPHRLRSWATFTFPHRIVLSPAVDWRTGFPFSPLNIYHEYAGPPNSERYPDYFSIDATAFKTFDLFGHEMDLGLQAFNITGHSNPRDVVAVVDSPNYREFANSFGVTFGGYMQIRWH
jgi:hypothetical protein